MNEAARVDPTVFVIDDDAAIRTALIFLFEHERLNAEAFASVDEFLEHVAPARAGCLILDVRMPGMSGLTFLERARRLGVTQPAIILTGHADVPMAVRAFKHGALEFIEKPYDNQALVAAVRSAIATDLARRRREGRSERLRALLSGLSAREHAVLDEIVAGSPHKVIASRLNVSVSTVEVHRKHILEKLGAPNAATLIRMVLSVREAPRECGRQP